jgi:hypothetical protein
MGTLFGLTNVKSEKAENNTEKVKKYPAVFPTKPVESNYRWLG